MTTKVMIMEDEEAIRGFIRINLKREGFTVIEAGSGEEALQIALEENEIDIAILDIMLPGIDGFEVCQHLRSRYPRMGIIMLTARGQEQDKIEGFALGADDYVVKPFSPAELMARVRALLRRMNKPGNNDLIERRCGPFKIMFTERKLFKHDKEIELTPREYAVVELLMKRPGKAFSREEIMDKIWGFEYAGDYKVVDVNIRRIRQKIEDDPAQPVYMETVWGFGYRWGKED
ncbi:MAG: response regulator transcription factor [Syntrophomonadaceae bacterium]|nr:response regulator transcription factor [Syntrophomonadaceae bacterium]MDD3889387.1 response regulator transcription factor [Syntrophomonadaceae bacterium]MDD4548452.1 response regulator transcription factor [Syntrophomonadaceae bacterium]